MTVTIALVNPGKRNDLAIHPPMNLGYIASYLELHDYEVQIIDELAGQNVDKELDKTDPDIVGITGTTPLILDAYRVIDFVKREIGCKVIMGGVHASALPEEALGYGADVVVVGEGEKAMLKIVKGDVKKGIVYGEIIYNIDEIPPPSWHLMDMEFYVNVRKRLSRTHLAFVPPRTRVGSLITSRGCPYRCRFCYNSWQPTLVRYHSAERVIEEVKLLVDDYHIKALMFMDDEFLANKRRFQKICELWEQEGFDLIWGCQARSDTISRVGLNTLKLARKIGCMQIGIGFESGSEIILSYLKAGTSTLEHNEKAYDLCRKAGIIPFGTFIIGSPMETVNDIKRTFDWIKRHPMPAGIFYLTPYPGTMLWEELKQEGRIPEKLDWSKFTTGDIPFPICDAISESALRRLFKEIYQYIETFRPLPISTAVKCFIKHPFRALCATVKHPASILKRLSLE